jgi:multiple sugar transport system ATP-binding protein
MRTVVSRLQKRTGVTTVYVTHDQVEAITLGDRVVVLRRGTLQQVGTPRELYQSPANLFVAGFIGAPPMNLLPAEILPDRLRLPFGDIPFDTARLPASLAGKDLIIAGIRPEHVEDVRLLDDEHRRRGVTFKAPVDVLEWLGDEQVAYLPFEAPERIRRQLTELQRELDTDSDRTQLIVKLDEASDVREGDEIELWFDPRNLHLFDPVTSENVTLGA